MKASVIIPGRNENEEITETYNSFVDNKCTTRPPQRMKIHAILGKEGYILSLQTNPPKNYYTLDIIKVFLYMGFLLQNF